MNDWPFEDAPNTAVITTGGIVAGADPILRVTHDADDGSWQFLPGTSVGSADARIVALSRICRLDPGVYELADLAEGWVASRPRAGAPWSRQPI